MRQSNHAMIERNYNLAYVINYNNVSAFNFTPRLYIKGIGYQHINY